MIRFVTIVKIQILFNRKFMHESHLRSPMKSQTPRYIRKKVQKSVEIHLTVTCNIYSVFSVEMISSHWCYASFLKNQFSSNLELWKKSKFFTQICRYQLKNYSTIRRGRERKRWKRKTLSHFISDIKIVAPLRDCLLKSIIQCA